MTSIYFDGAVRLKSHSSVTRGGKSTIKIELETTDHFDQASIMRQLDQIGAAQREQDKPKKTVQPPAAKAKQLALPAPLRRIEDLREGDL